MSATETMTRCGGHCCKIVQLPVPVEWIRAMVPLDGDPTKVLVGVQGEGAPRVNLVLDRTDAETIGDMLTSVDACEEEPAWWRDGMVWEGARWFYSHRCRHWVPESGLCAIYERRPTMCREYPYGEPCGQRRCGQPLEQAPGKAEG